MAQMLDIINVSSVTIVLPKVMVDVGFQFDQLQWVSSAYALAYGAFLLLGGRLGDLFGHRNIYILGVTWFSIWAIVNGFAHSPVMMSVGRALQGMGAGFTVPSALAILTTTYPAGPERNKALGIFGGTAAIGSVVGVLLGGILGSTIGFSLTILGFLAIPAEKAQGKVEDRRLDVFGMIAFTVGIVTIIYYLSESPAQGWSSTKTLVPLFIGFAMLISFIVIERKIDYPIMPPHIWRSRRFLASCATALCMMAALNAHAYFASLALQNVLGYSSLKASLAFITHGIGAIIAVGVISMLTPYVRSKVILVVGWVLLIVSGVMWAQLKVDSSYWSIPFPSFIVNLIAMVAIWLTCQINSVSDAADEDQGVVGAVYNVCLQIGAPLGIAISNIIANNKNGLYAVGAQLLPGYLDAFYSYSVMAGVGLVVTLILYPNSDQVRSPTGAERLDVEAVVTTDGDDERVAKGNRDEVVGDESEINSKVTVVNGSSSSLEKRV
ncbi:hypothetical protein BGZ79_006976 [Entomortierella chlamydospora]|nr:hypothetical protein BGZ79_006976 [Entomortierella chlamydospora]